MSKIFRVLSGKSIDYYKRNKYVISAATALSKGKVVVFPTDTVYGIGADADNNNAINKIYKLKNRSSNKPLILLFGSNNAAAMFILKHSPELYEKSKRIIEQFLPGPLTLVLRENIAIRVPDHPVAQAILELANKPVATTSANISGSVAPLSAEDIHLNGYADLIIDGGITPIQQASTILDLRTIDILRHGAINLFEIRQALSPRILFVCTGNTCRSPLAEYILKELTKTQGVHLNIKSAGTSAYNGSPISPGSAHILSELHIIHNHTSSFINTELLEWADIVLTMTRNHKDILCNLTPCFEHKIYTLKGYTDNSRYEWELDISDPWGGDTHVYRSCAKEIRLELLVLMEKLKGYINE